MLRGKPFFVTFMTVSLHTPFKYPAGKCLKAPPGTVPPAGFKAEELNNYLYADWAVGDFLDKASTRDYFHDTIFIFVGITGSTSGGKIWCPLTSIEWCPSCWHRAWNREG